MTYEEAKKIIAERSRMIHDFLKQRGYRIWEEQYNPELGSIAFYEGKDLFHLGLSAIEEDYVHMSLIEILDQLDEKETAHAESVANRTSFAMMVAKAFVHKSAVFCAAEFYCTPFDSFKIVFARYLKRIKIARDYFMKEMKKPAAPDALRGSLSSRLSTPILDSLSMPRLSFGSPPQRRDPAEQLPELIREILRKINTPQ